MPPSDLATFRLYFMVRLAKARGQEFQNLFSAIMSRAHTDFMAVRTQGSLGDQKNDGFVPSTGTYYQVYAPGGDISEAEAIKKLKEDFAGLHAHWSSIYPLGIKKFYFVINDYYNWAPGAYPTTYQELEKLKQQYGLNDCGVFSTTRLEEEFIQLPRDVREMILGAPIPAPEAIGSLDFYALNDVIRHIYDNPVDYPKNGTLVAPEFLEKIKFNGLTKCEHLLVHGAWQCHAVESFFEKNGNIAAHEVRNKLNSIYNFHLENSPNCDPNILFFDVLEDIIPPSPDAGKRYKQNLTDAAVVLMAYFFESCDIFEEPPYDHAR